MNLREQFQAATQHVDNLPADQAAAHMTEFYGLYKQATEGDVNMKAGEVDPAAADQASGPAGLSQAQWDSWNQFKGVPEEEAMRRYVAKAAEIGGPAAGNGAAAVPTDATTGAPTGPPDHGPGQRTPGGLRGDLAAGAPYGGEDRLKDEQ